MTGSGRARSQTEPAAPAVNPEAKVEPTQKTGVATPNSGQPQLGGLDSADGQTTSAAEEEMLEIPAFLRRQAN